MKEFRIDFLATGGREAVGKDRDSESARERRRFVNEEDVDALTSSDSFDGMNCCMTRRLCRWAATRTMMEMMINGTYAPRYMFSWSGRMHGASAREGGSAATARRWNPGLRIPMATDIDLTVTSFAESPAPYSCVYSQKS